VAVNPSNGRIYVANSISNTVLVMGSSYEQSYMSLSIQSGRSRLGENIVLTGTMKPPQTARIELNVTRPNGSATIIQVATNSTGGFSHQVALDQKGTWRMQASWKGGRRIMPCRSNILVFEVSAYSLRVNLQDAGFWVKLNSERREGPSVVFEASAGEHTLEAVPQIVEDGARWIFTRWSDNSVLNPRIIRITDDAEFTAIYSIEYLVQVSSGLGTVSGEGWYPANSSVTVSVSPTSVSKDFFTSYVFENWRANGTVVSDSSTYSFTVTCPVSLEAGWRTELNLTTIISIIGGILIIVTIIILLLQCKPKLPPPSA
jgi:hypothetical protein